MKLAAPFMAPASGLASLFSSKDVERQLDMTKKLLDALPSIEDTREFTHSRSIEKGSERHLAEGAELRALRQMLDELDPSQTWGNLRKILTPEGHYLWLCDQHAEEYRY